MCVQEHHRCEANFSASIYRREHDDANIPEGGGKKQEVSYLGRTKGGTTGRNNWNW